MEMTGPPVGIWATMLGTMKHEGFLPLLYSLENVLYCSQFVNCGLYKVLPHNFESRERPISWVLNCILSTPGLVVSSITIHAYTKAIQIGRRSNLKVNQ
jgi:hypothetical protein